MMGANDGLVSVASLLMGVGGVKEDMTTMVLAWFVGLVTGACSMALGEFVSVYTQYDIEKAQIEKEKEVINRDGSNEEAQKEKPPNPFHAAPYPQHYHFSC
ncbi:hypothetical protein L6164_033422 [Bauhinia variegata]|uniref:Uncharacterized protein n=1 Tax=Bauhinia variegata TaxID=167791 RepID=A0ACB9KRV1_BAUVA|nr:hypothetical protein L6164_033422 [Bauhinia variegata]